VDSYDDGKCIHGRLHGTGCQEYPCGDAPASHPQMERLRVPAWRGDDDTRQLVRLRISGEMLVRHLLHLPVGELEAASVECFPGAEASTLCLYLRYPGVPEGCEEMSPVYTRHGSGKVELTGISWYAHDGGPVLILDEEFSGG
jgi:hypothetical protein